VPRDLVLVLVNVWIATGGWALLESYFYQEKMVVSLTTVNTSYALTLNADSSLTCSSRSGVASEDVQTD